MILISESSHHNTRPKSTSWLSLATEGKARKESSIKCKEYNVPLEKKYDLKTHICPM